MKRLLTLILATTATVSCGEDADRSAPVPGESKEAPPPDPHAGHSMPDAGQTASGVDAHSAHGAPRSAREAGAARDPHAAHRPAPGRVIDPHAGHAARAGGAGDAHGGHRATDAGSATPRHAGHRRAGGQGAPASHTGHPVPAAHDRQAAPTQLAADAHSGHPTPAARPSEADPHTGHGAPPPSAQGDPHRSHAAPPATAQPDPHAAHAQTSVPTADPHAGHAAPPSPAQPDPHAGHPAPSVPVQADGHAGHAMPAQQPATDPHAGHGTAPSSTGADPHAGHAMPAQQPATDPHAGHGTAPSSTGADPHAGHAMSPADRPSAPPVAPPPAEATSGPPHAADTVFGAGEMSAARDALRMTHGDHSFQKFVVEQLEVSLGDGPDGYAWEDAQFWYGGDIDKLWLKSEGEGAFGEGFERGDVQALWSHAIGPWFDLQAGVRMNFGPGPERPHLVLGLQGLAPYWFEIDASAFLSSSGDVTGRIEAEHDGRITQRLILQPRLELDWALQDVPELGIGSGLSSAEAGLRLRYEVVPEFAPYVGIAYEHAFGDSARFARAAGDDPRRLNLLVGVRVWF